MNTEENKNLEGIPREYYFKYGFESSNIFIFPTPLTSSSITISSFKELNSITSLDDDLPYPNPYLSALKYNLAIELAAEYSIDVPTSVIAMAQQTLESIIRLNRKKPPQSVFDTPSRYEWYNNYLADIYGQL